MEVVVRQLILGLALASVVACDGIEKSPVDDSGLPTLTTDSESTEDPVVSEPVAFATQVGSEGIWGCPVLSIDDVEPGEIVPEFGLTPSELASSTLRDWQLELDGVPGQLSWLEPTAYSWVELDGCDGYLAMQTIGSLAAEPSAGLQLEGTVAISAVRMGATLYAKAADDRVVEQWGASALPGESWLRLGIEFDDAKLAGALGWAMCRGPECAEQAALAKVDGTPL